MWVEVIRWVGIVLCFVSVGLNMWAFVRSQRAFKRYMALYKELLLKYFDQSIAEMKSYLEDDTDS